MPHVTLEYSANVQPLDVQKLLRTVNQAMIDTGEFESLDIKSRAVKQEEFLIGLADSGHAYIHVKVALLSGRSAETKLNISKQLLDVLHSQLLPIAGIRLQLCVEMQDIDRVAYSKAVL